MPTATMPLAFTLQAMLFSMGVMYALMAVTVWFMLLRRHERVPTALWSAGSLLVGFGLVLVGLRSAVPEELGFLLPNVLMQWSLTLRVLALRFDLGQPLHARAAVALTIAAGIGYALASQADGMLPRIAYGSSVLLIGTLVLAQHAWAAGRRLPSRSGLVLACAEWVAAAIILIRLAGVLLGRTDSIHINSLVEVLILTSMGLFASVYGNLAYLGLVFDRIRGSERRAHQAREVADIDRAAAVHTATELRDLLAQRDQLIGERNHLLQVLAHEIGQPMHNLSGALQSAALALRRSEGDTPSSAAAPLRHAQALLGTLQSLLDNALASSTLLTRSQPLQVHDTELDLVVDLALGDLQPAERARVSIRRATTLRSLDVEPGLVRLALRNLLNNAFRHGGPDVHATIVLRETLHPPTLVLAVEDDGLGAAAAVLAEAASASEIEVEPPSPTSSRGLGLYIVRRVMALHGGRLLMTPRSPRGLVAALEFVLPADDEVDLLDAA